jgi:hypothetical protein
VGHSGRFDRGILAHAKVKTFKTLLSWLASVCLEMSVRYEVRLAEIFFQSKQLKLRAPSQRSS